MNTLHGRITADDLARASCPPGTEAPRPPGARPATGAVIGTPQWPFISCRTTELPLPGELVVRAGLVCIGDDVVDGLGYADEREEDRDRDGGLWARVSTDLAGGGDVENLIPHPYRHRYLMGKVRCQVCAQDPARNDDGGFLFVVPDGPHDLAAIPANWGDGVLEATPPVCLADADASATGCPRLGRATALWVQRPILHGVSGLGYRLRGGTLLETGVAYARYETAELAWVVAQQMYRRLDGVTVDLELTAHLRSLHAAAWPARRRRAPDPAAMTGLAGAAHRSRR
ncbi:hypothetical protein OTB20_39260 [Streptomyces sp. H27-H1]|uniref:hypothetical protein n=1 Tax=Streptomyces sp. H27-H1 TaxID=2996461 RepID=UPI00226ED2C3|nr:hypothetical protein [Streptomyces sp. H27-H1]MCY0932110.1 hypothetical protein [Streptomyces sp. H27-H1]